MSDAPSEQELLDHRRLLAEIEAEVRRKVESGELDPALERELDTLFDQLVPDHAPDSDFEAVLDRAERAALIDLSAPTESTRAAFVPVKKTVRRLVLWYFDYVVGQVVHFAGTISRATRLLGERVTKLERRVRDAERAQAELRAELAAPGERVLRAVRGVAADRSGPWVGMAVEAMKGAEGRVLHADCGDGALVRALVDAGVDAYGTDPAEELVAVALEAGLEARPDGAVEHLRTVGAGALAGLVLSGCVDYRSVADQLELAELAGSRLAPRAPLVLIGVRPEAWGRGPTRAEADLAPGRPLHPETWQALLARCGFEELEVLIDESAAEAFALRAVRRP